MAHPDRNSIYQATIRRMVTQALDAQEREFASAHACDSAEALLQHLRICAKQLGHAPWPREVVGGTYVQQRFGSWEAALAQAGLEMPQTPDKMMGFARVREEYERQRLIYRSKKAEKKQLSEKSLQTGETQ